MVDYDGIEIGNLRELLERTAVALRDVHSALDDALGDSDVTHMDDDELRAKHPVQWAAERLAKVIEGLEN